MITRACEACAGRLPPPGESLCKPCARARARADAVAPRRGEALRSSTPWRPEHPLYVEEPPPPPAIDGGPRRPVPCAVCRRALAASGQPCKACARAARRAPPRPAQVGLAARLESTPIAGLGPSAPRVRPSGWAPAHALFVDDEPEPSVEIDAGPRRPVPCKVCGRALAAHGERCKACARAARRAPPKAGPRGLAARLSTPPAPGGADRAVTPRVEPSGWRPAHALFVQEARFRVERDRRNTFVPRAPSSNPQA